MNKLLHFDYSGLRRILLEAVVIVCLGLGLGLSFNYPLLMTIFRVGVAPALPTAATGTGLPVMVTRAEVEALGERALRVDARIRELYAAGHLPKAVSLPLDEIDTALPAFTATVPTATSLVVYCSGYGCSDSFDLAEKLLAAGYADVMVYEGGFPEWHDAGLPVEAKTP